MIWIRTASRSESAVPGVAPPDPAPASGKPDRRRVLPPTRRQHGKFRKRLTNPILMGMVRSPRIDSSVSRRSPHDKTRWTTTRSLPRAVLGERHEQIEVVHHPSLLIDRCGTSTRLWPPPLVLALLVSGQPPPPFGHPSIGAAGLSGASPHEIGRVQPLASRWTRSAPTAPGTYIAGWPGRSGAWAAERPGHPASGPNHGGLLISPSVSRASSPGQMEATADCDDIQVFFFLPAQRKPPALGWGLLRRVVTASSRTR
jgi:hypothetical protein